MSVGSLLYLFLSFLFPSREVTAAAPEVRIAAIGLALVSVSLFVWSPSSTRTTAPPSRQPSSGGSATETGRTLAR